MMNDTSLFGMRKFSLQSPKVRNYLGESLYHKFLNYLDVPSLRYRFVKFSINGKSLGTYAIEEHFDKLIIENNNLREGIILGLDEETNMFEAKRKYQDRRVYSDGYYLKFPIKLLDEKSIYGNEKLNNQYFQASNLLNKFLRKELLASEVFDIERLAKFLAISDLTGANHGLFWDNIRLIYNPINQKLIPLGYDGLGGYKTQELANQTGAFVEAFNDEKLIKAYIAQLERVSSKNFLDDFFENYDKKLGNEIKLIHRTYPWSKSLSFYKDNIYYNAGFIRQRLNPLNPLNINLNSFDKDKLKFNFFNYSEFPIQINDIYIGNKILSKNKILVNPRINFRRADPKEFTFENNFGVDIYNFLSTNKKIQFSYNIIGSEIVYKSKLPLRLIQNSNYDIKNNFLFKNDTTKGFKFIRRDEKNKLFEIDKGNWIIENPLIFPSGYKIIAREGVNLNLQNKGIIISRSPIDFKGEKNRKININSNNDAMGLLVLNAKENSIVSYVNFNGLSAPNNKELKSQAQ